MSENERETAFLGRLISYEGTAESQQLRAKLARAQENENCVGRAVRLAIALVLLALVGLGYREALLEQGTTPRDSGSFIANCFYGLGLGSLLSLLVFVALGAIYRRLTNQRKDEARQFLANLLKAHLSQPAAVPERAGPAPQARVGTEKQKPGTALDQKVLHAAPAVVPSA